MSERTRLRTNEPTTIGQSANNTAQEVNSLSPDWSFRPPFSNQPCESVTHPWGFSTLSLPVFRSLHIPLLCTALPPHLSPLWKRSASLNMPFKHGEFMEETTMVRDQDIFDKTGFTRRDEADMAEQGKRQQLNVSPLARWHCEERADASRGISASCRCLGLLPP